MAMNGYRFIIWFEFLRSFCYYGVQVMLFFLFYAHLGWSLSFSVAMVHLHGIIFYSFAMVGLYIAEQRKSVLVNNFGVVAIVGNTLIFVAVLVNDVAQHWAYLQIFKEVLIVTGVLLRSIGAGLIREIPLRIAEDMASTEDDQRKVRSQFYLGLFYAFSGGIALAAILLPALRMNVVWMGKNMCWPLPIGLATVCMIGGLGIFNGGAASYSTTTYTPNNIKRVMQCVVTGDAYREADYRVGDYDDEFAENSGQAGRVVLLFLPLPIFWALFEQLWTRWPYQGLRMDGLVMGTLPIEPDAMFLAIPFVNMSVLPFFEYVCFPLLAKVVFCRTPKTRIAVGALLAIVAFLLAGTMEYYVEGEKEHVTPTFKKGHADLVIWNPTRCPLNATFDGLPGYQTAILPAATVIRLNQIPCENRVTFRLTFIRGLKRNVVFCRVIHYPHIGHELYIYEDKVTAYQINPYVRKSDLDANNDPVRTTLSFPLTEDIMLRDHVKGGLQVPVVGYFYRTLINRTVQLAECRELELYNPLRFSTRQRHLYANKHHKDFELHPQGKYYTLGCGAPLEAMEPTVHLRKGGVYLINPITRADGIMTRDFQVLEEPFKTPIWWTIPQYLMMGLAQLLCPALLLDYSHRQVNRTMVPFLLFMWLFMAALGNLIVFVEALCNFWSRPFHLYIFYAVLMAVAFVVLCVLLFLYEHLEPEIPEEEEGEVEMEED